jgi:hypothetical protein
VAPYFVVTVAWLIAPIALALTSIDVAVVSPDITVELDGVVFHDEHVADDDLAGATLLVSIGTIPGETALNAYHEDTSSGDQLLSFDTTVELAGAVVVKVGDVARYDGVGYAIEFDATAEGLADGVGTDAISETAGGDLILSFDTTVDLGGGLIVDDEDLVSFDGASFSLLFDGSVESVPRSLDLDAAHLLLENGNLILSFDTSGTIGGVTFDDEDLLEFTPGPGTWEMAYDGSALHAEWPPADLQSIVIVPEPARIALLASGLAFLAAVGRGRS